jgi:3-phosphoshikimate 1-carboxyvinyltransferase
VSLADSSQFASALLLAGGVGGWQVEITGANEDELPYVDMTRELVKVFPAHDGEFQIEPDASSGSYFWAADWIQWIRPFPNGERAEPNSIVVKDWPKSDLQVDAKYRELRDLQLEAISRRNHVADSIMVAIVKAPLNRAPIQHQHHFPSGTQPNTPSPTLAPRRFTDLGRLRVQECERVFALRTELTKCGADVREEGDTLTVYPSALHGAEIETYDDHRMAMCFAVLGLKVPGIKIKNPACVKKTFPNFFQKLATPPPHGLGAEIRDAATGRKLALEELFAD